MRAVGWVLGATAAATVAVEILNLWYAPEGGFGLAVRTGWALLRTVGWVVLLWHVRRGRPAARPLSVILAVTTVFAVGRLIVPRTGTPPLPGAVGFAVLTVLCVTAVVLLHRHPALSAHLTQHPRRLVATRQGLQWRAAQPRRAPANGWLVTARVAAFTYSPLVLLPCLIAVGELAERPEYLPAVVFWFALGIGVSYAVLLTTYFLLRGRAWARRSMVAVTLGVLALDLPLCWLLLGVDGLVRDGAPLLAAATLTLVALHRAPAVDPLLTAGGTG